ncbi:PqqD family protein [Sphingobacterium sp. LRF_L2]|uniref:PqqD family protein n=1 Tax=Sphingobacterium sp. LRF_L2 TaxID=3369421 RepID=UPI003F6241B8
MKLRKDLILRHIGDDYIIVEPGQEQIDLSKVYTLNETAAWLWEELKNKDFALEDMVALLCSEYDVTADIALIDAKQLVRDFQKQGLIID